MTMARQRALTVRPQNADDLLPLQGEESGDAEVPKDEAEGGLTEETEEKDAEKDEWSELQSKVEDMQKKVA